MVVEYFEVGRRTTFVQCLSKEPFFLLSLCYSSGFVVCNSVKILSVLALYMLLLQVCFSKVFHHVSIKLIVVTRILSSIGVYVFIKGLSNTVLIEPEH